MPLPQFLVRIVEDGHNDIVALKSLQERKDFIAYMGRYRSCLTVEPITRAKMYGLGIYCFSPASPSKYGFREQREDG